MEKKPVASHMNPQHERSGPYEYTRIMHKELGFKFSESIVEYPSVSDRERRLRLIYEEFLELVDAMGFTLDLCKDGDANFKLMPVHVEGSRYDPVETADALGDLNVVVNGTAVEFGIPMRFVDHEIFCSNMSKGGPDGKAILNGIAAGYKEGEPGYRADLPIGKGLKPDTYIPANIKYIINGALKAEEDSEWNMP